MPVTVCQSTSAWYTSWFSWDRIGWVLEGRSWREEQRSDLLDRVDPERGACRTSPQIGPGRAEDLALDRVVHHGEAQSVPRAVERRLGEEWPPELLQVRAPRQVVARHVVDGTGAQQSHAVELATTPEHLDEPVVVRRGTDQSAATGQCRRHLEGSGAECVLLDRHTGRGIRGVQRGETPGVGFGHVESAVDHAEGTEDRSARNSSRVRPDATSTTLPSTSVATE